MPRAILAVDVEKFSDPTRTELHKLLVRKGLYDSLEQAFVESGIDWGDCYHEDRGDGVFFLLSPDIPKAVLAEYLLRRLIAALLRYNAGCAQEAQIRLRVSLHHGDVYFDDQGASGDAVIHVFRLLDAQPLKAALASSSSVLAIIVSELFYHEVVRNDPAAEPSSYRSISAAVKETRAPAWMRLSAETMPMTNNVLTASKRPSSGELPPEIPIGEESAAELAELLVQVPLLGEATGRKLCLEVLGHLLGQLLVVPYFDDARPHVYSMALTCGRNPGALRCLAAALDRLQPESPVVGKVRRLVDEMSALDLIETGARRRLMALLRSATSSQIGECYRLAAGIQGADAGPDWHDVLGLLGGLERMNAKADGVPPVLAFVEHLAGRVEGVLATHLREWNAAQAAHMMVVDELKAFQATVIFGRSPARTTRFGSATLLVRIQPHGLDQERYLLSEWRQLESPDLGTRRATDHVCTLSEVEARVAELVDRAEGGWAKDASTINVQFILPMELLNLPVDQFLLRSDELPEPIGVEYQVSIRSLERSRSREKHRRWRQRWTASEVRLQATDGSIDQAVLWSVPEGVNHLRKLGVEFARSPNVVAMVLSGPPLRNGVFGAGEVAVGLNAGVPIMIWDRRDRENEEFEAAVRAMLVNGGLADLLENVRLLRGKAFSADDSDAHPGSYLSVLWDDPDRMVEPRPEEVTTP